MVGIRDQFVLFAVERLNIHISVAYLTFIVGLSIEAKPRRRPMREEEVADAVVQHATEIFLEP